MSCSDFNKQRVKKLLDLGCGQGRDTIFFASNDLDVHALDSSSIAIENVYKKLREKTISIDLKHFDARQGIPFSNNFFDAIYAHMFFNMRLTDQELKFLFIESGRVLKNNGLLYFSVRSDKDAQYNKGNRIDDKKSSFFIPDIMDVQIESFVNPVTAEEQDTKIQLPKGFIWKLAEAAKTKLMRISTPNLNFDDSGKNAFYSVVEFSVP
jgi:ubiquinone/menaquinone biosynthesis C-methylase UbiE